MLFGKKPYPILPTSESDTLTFLQKLDLLEYKVAEMTNKIYEIETTLATKSTVSATASSGEIQTITVDGVTYNVPQGTEVSATGSEGTLETITVDGTTYNVPQGGDAGEKGSAITTEGGLTRSMFQWRLINDIFVVEFILMNATDALNAEGIQMQLRDKDNNNWTGLDGKTIKTSISWIHDFGVGSHDYAPVTAEIQLSVSSNGGCNISAPKGFTVPSGYTAFTANTALQEIGGIPIVFMTVGLI